MGANLWAISCYFNPNGYQTKRQNFARFRSGLRDHGIPLLAIELTRPGEAPVLQKHDAERVLSVTSDSVLWQKERLFNIAAQHLPESCDTVLFCDADLLFPSPTFVPDLLATMQSHTVAQAFARFVRLPRGAESLEVETCRYAYEQDGAMMTGTGANWEQFGEEIFHAPELFGFPGGAWVTTKTFAQQIGWYDKAVVGGGDVLMFLGSVGEGRARQRQPMTPTHEADYLAWVDRCHDFVLGRVGAVPGDALHLWHGDPQRRGYESRDQILTSMAFDPSSDLLGAAGEPWRWSAHKSELAGAVKEYFASRQEDLPTEVAASERATPEVFATAEAERSICIVANMLDYLDATCGIGTYNLQLARLLKRHGWDVTILYAGDVQTGYSFADLKTMLAREGIALWEVSELTENRTKERLGEPEASARMIADALDELHESRCFGIVEFSDWNAPGYLAVQRQRFKKTWRNLLVRLHGPSSWGRRNNGYQPQGWNKITAEFREQKTCEHAPHLLAPSRYIIDYFEKDGWQIPQSEVLTLPLMEPQPAPPTKPIDEIVFFGRVDIRKGCDVFCEAVEQLPESVKVTFLGPLGYVPPREGLPVTNPPTLLRGREYQLLADMDREQALAYLGTGNRLAVIPSRAETFGYTVAECASSKIPFITSRYAALTDVVRDADVIDQITFALDPASLLAKIRSYISAAPSERQTWLDRAAAATTPQDREAEIVARYEELAREKRVRSPDPDVSLVPVTLGVVIRDHDYPEIQESLGAIRDQVHRHLEVLLCTDGSHNEHYAAKIQRMRQDYPRFRFIGTRNENPYRALLAAARHAYFVPLDTRTVLQSTFVRSLVTVAEENPELAAVACHATMRKLDEKGNVRGVTTFAPVGGPMNQAAYAENVLGELCSLYRTKALRDIGGFHATEHLHEGWRLFLRLRHRGYTTEVYPFHLLRQDVPFAIRMRSAQRVAKEILLQELMEYPAAHQYMEQLLRQFTLESFRQQTMRDRQLLGQIQELKRQLATSAPAARPGPQRNLKYEMVDKLDHVLGSFPRFRRALRRGLLRLTPARRGS